MEKIRYFFYDYLKETGMADSYAHFLNFLALLVITIVLVLLVDWVVRKLIRRLSVFLARKSRTNLDDIMITNKLPRYLAHLIPLWLLLELIPVVFVDFGTLKSIALKTGNILMVVLVLQIIGRFLRSIRDYLKTLIRFKDKPIDSYIQVFMIFAWIAGVMTIFVIITNITVWKFLTALGTVSAIILLLFKDTILGLVASIQVSVNDMVRIGDWISFEKYGADGDVIEINLATVKVQNWDKTITTIPTYALISDSFKNWRGMQESGGRRIKRALIIKQAGIRYLTAADLESMGKIQLIAEYIGSQSAKIEAYNQENDADKSLLINGRNLTNIGLFRKYIQSYLESHSAINKEMTLMTRQLSPTPQGIPIEIYAFSADQRWQNYEYIMSDIFDHLLAAVTYFDLEVFEFPTKIEVGTAGA